MNSKNIDWKNLGFDYMELPYRYRAYFREGSWQEQGLTEQSHLTLSEASTGLHYGQQGYEGLKAYRTKEGSIQLFRPEENAKRLQETCRRLAMPEVPTEMFVDAVKQVVLANEDFVPPYETGATLYLRPLIIGVGGMLGVQSAKEFLFTIFAMPVGVYFNKNKGNKKFVIAHEDDRVAPKGTGHIKAGGNYGGSIQTIEQAHEKGYDGVLYLDSKTHEYVEEAGSANVFGISKTGKLITPNSTSILPSITKYSLLQLARERFDLEVIEEPIPLDQLDSFEEMSACGTAAVVTSIGQVDDLKYGKSYHYKTEDTLSQKLKNELLGIQFGDIQAPERWIVKVK